MPTDPGPGRGWPAGQAQRMVVFGAGGHGKVVADAAHATNPALQLLAVDDDASRHAESWFVLTGQAVACQSSQVLPGLLAAGWRLHLAIGNNQTRQVLASRWGLVQPGASAWATVVHPSSVVSPAAWVGAGCLVAAGAVLAPDARLGQGVIVNHGAIVDHECQVGDFCHLAPGCVLGGAVQMGHGVLVGAGATVLPGLRICDGATIGAGAVVTQHITDPGPWVGVPARPLRAAGKEH